MTVKKTTGGTFEPAERPVYFAAGTNWTKSDVRWPPCVLVAVNDLPGADSEKANLLVHLDAGRKVLLDSGIFWLTNQHKRAHDVTMDEALALAPEDIDGFDDLYTRYVQLAQRYGDRLWGIIELDQGGAVNKRRTRARLEAEGIIPMPVYHPLNDGWDYFDELACGYDRMCFGNIVQASRPARLRLLHAMWERHRAYPDLWIHVLGLTTNEWCLSVPPDSCDSSTWLSPLRWPAVRTESAMLRKTGDLGRQFAYDLDHPDADGSTRGDAFGLCSDAVTSMNTVWTHAAARVADLLGQPLHPAHAPGERPASK
jgi:hypothetical protein